MADRLPFGEGASINNPPLFCGLNYQFWKVRMKIFVESLDNGLILKVRRPNLIALLKT